jgi:branched-chain amino acid transport system permease protein
MAELYLNVIAGGVLIGLVYALIAIGLTVIFGVMRIVNFAHGEMVVIGMYGGYWAFELMELNALMAMPLAAAVLFVIGYALQRGIVNRFIAQPQHVQFILFISFALIITGLHVICGICGITGNRWGKRTQFVVPIVRQSLAVIV